jgi:hypothetical protein
MCLRTFEPANTTRLFGPGPADKGDQSNFSIFFSAHVPRIVTLTLFIPLRTFELANFTRLCGVGPADK